MDRYANTLSEIDFQVSLLSIGSGQRAVVSGQ